MDTRSHYETDRHTTYQLGRRSGRVLTLFAMGVAMLSFYSFNAHASRPIMLVDQSCVISVLNRTVQADEKGAFRLDNVPSFLGKVRARATCTRNGETFSGESDYFDIPLNGFVRVSQFYEMVDELTPNKLRVLGSQSITMTGVDSVKRLTVLADYPNGNIKPVTAGIWGTNYTSSNPSTVAVDVNGVLRANSPGRALITVRKDGVITVVTVNVVTSGDRDQDGIPDEVELANGLDPDDPVDALEDQDGDGLTAIKEYSEGTEINNADTDGDGISDGEELIAGIDGYITNPLLEDSDGDGINDKLEMDLGSDPTDINDAPYVDAMTGLSVTPESALLFYNTIDNESSFQLTVEGLMVDGSNANLTPLSRGTTYSSSDLDIASFSAVPGRVFAGIDGDATVTATNNGFAADSHVSVLSYAPVPLGALQLPFRTSNVALTNDYAYVVGLNGEFAIVSFADAANIRIEGLVDVASDAIDVLVNGAFAYVLTANRLVVVDVSDVINPVVVKNMPLVGITGFDIKGNYLYVSAGFNLYVLSVTSPGNPVLINTKALEENALDVKAGDILAIDTGVEILAYSLLSAVNPQLIGRQTIGATGFAVKGESVLVAGTTSNYPTIDFSDPSSPVLTDPIVGGFSPVDIAVAGDHAFYADALFVGGVIPYVNVEDIRNPIYQGIIDFQSYAGGSCSKIASTLSHSVCTSEKRIVITQQRQVQDLAGIAPTVTLLEPLNDLTLYQDRPYRFSFNVVDDERVATVLYYVNDELVTTDSSAPYEFIYRLPDDGSELIVRTDALDMAGNLGSSGDILFVVEPLSGAADEVWRGVSIDYLDDDLLSGSIVMEGSSLISDFAVTTVDNFRFEVSDSIVNVDRLNVEGDLVVDGVTVTINSANGINVLGDIRIINGGALTVPDVNSGSKVIYPLVLSSGGELFVDASSSIDLNGSGYPSNRYAGPDFSLSDRYSCHGGMRTVDTDRNCVYGHYDQAVFAGSGGWVSGGNNAYGGGIVDIVAGSVLVNGNISAKGNDGLAANAGGAGGSVSIKANTIAGAGYISVEGAKSTNQSAGGGRIVLNAPTIDDVTLNTITGNSSAGAGTVFIKPDNQLYGTLVVDNEGNEADPNSTPVKNVGLHNIVSIEALGENDQWKITVPGAPWKASSEIYQWGIDGLWVMLDASDDAATRFQIVTNTANTITIVSKSDLSGFVNSKLVGIHLLDRLVVANGAWVDFGEDRVHVLELENSSVDGGSTVSADYFNNDYIASTLNGGGNVVLTEPVVFDGFNLSGSADVRLVVPSLQVLGDFSIAGLNLELPESTSLVVGGNLLIDSNATLKALTINAQTVDVNYGTLITENLFITNDLAVNGAGKITTPSATILGQHIYSLNLVAGGTITVAYSGHIDLDGKGYPSNYYSGPDFTNDMLSGNHGGVFYNSDSTRVYGRYERAQHAGSARFTAGGGFINIQSDSLVLNGKITADGALGTPAQKGAGGGIHLGVTHLSGNGLVSANGAAANLNHVSRMSGAGGRVSIYSENRSLFNGELSAASGDVSVASGAGTVYLQDYDAGIAKTTRHLWLDNKRFEPGELTPLRRVGKHKIIGVYQPTPGVWKVEVANAPWLASGGLDKGFNGVDGLFVDLDASTESGELYEIVSNAEGVLEIHSDATDLYSVVGNDLVGVHVFDTLKVEGGATADFGEDRLVINDLDNSRLGSNSVLSVGEISQSLFGFGGNHFGHLVLRNTPLLSNVVWESSVTGILEFDDAVAINQLTVDQGTVIFSGGLSLSGALTSNNGSITATTLTVDSIELNGGTIITEELTVVGNIAIHDNAVLTVPSADIATKHVFGLDVVAGGSVAVDLGGKIDLDGKGYAASNYSGPDFSYNTRIGSHAGVFYESDISTVYGRYERAQYAGSAYQASGGGLLELQAVNLVLDGSIVANGLSTGNNKKGAGGSVHINVDNLSGGAEGLISVNGGSVTSGSSSRIPGAGGRISLYTQNRSAYAGTLEAASGDVSFASGSGTIYLQDYNVGTSATTRNLWLNNLRSSTESLTPIRRVGRHEIVGIYESTPGVWKVEVAGSPWSESGDYDIGVDGGLDGLYVDLDASTDVGELYVIVKNSKGVLEVHSNTDLSGVIGNDLIGVHVLDTLRIEGGATADFGGDRLVINDPESSFVDSVSSLRVGEMSRAMIEALDENIEGRLEFLNVNSFSDLELATTFAGELVFDGAVTFNQLTLHAGSLRFPDKLTVLGAFNIDGGDVTAMELNVASLEINKGTLITELLNVSGDITIHDGGVLTVPDADLATKHIFGLNITAGGIVTVELGGLIDLDGKGYPANLYSGPDFVSVGVVNSSHGGVRYGADLSDVYGRYEQAEFAGSSAYSDGGGFVEINANGLVLDGVLSANGISVHSRQGAGGGIHINVVNLSGASSGVIRANGGSVVSNTTNYVPGPGGRVSIYSQDRSLYSGIYEAAGGDMSIAASASGAGTVYLQDYNVGTAQTLRHLWLDNNRLETTSLTPVRRVGRHTIVGIYQSTPGVWKVEVANNPWIASGGLDRGVNGGLDGLFVDLDASTETGDLYQIITNGEGVIEIHSSDTDLYNALGNDLVGVHTFETLRVEEGASVDFGDDRVVINDPQNSMVDATSSLAVGRVSQSLFELNGNLDGKLILRDTPTLDGFELSNAFSGELTFDDAVVISQLTLNAGSVNFLGGVSVSGALVANAGNILATNLQAESVEIGNGATVASGELSVVNDITIHDGGTLTALEADVASKHISPLDIVAGGIVSVELGGQINVDGKGYIGKNYSGPDFSVNSRMGSHGGVRYTDDASRAYGVIERAQFAGSAQDSDGGGVVLLEAVSLVVDGLISANGDDAYGQNKGAGGSVHINTANISGGVTGIIRANGGSALATHINRLPGAGGRISIYSDDRAGYLGLVQAASGDKSYASGAGTVYWLDGAETLGHLVVNNNGRAPTAGTTPIRSVGLQTINSIELVGIGKWRVTVSGSPWMAQDESLGWGLGGLYVDLNSADADNDTVYEITTNTTNTFDIATFDDIGASVTLGDSLVGVRYLASFTEEFAGMTDFGGDRLVIVDSISGSDSDNDGLSDADEVIWLTQSDNPDSDGDGVVDGLEVALGLEPNNSAVNDISASVVTLEMAPNALNMQLAEGDSTSQLVVTAKVVTTGKVWHVDVTNPALFAVSFASDSALIADVSTSGLVTGVASGAANVIASFAGYNASTVVNVLSIADENWVDITKNFESEYQATSLMLDGAVISSDYSLISSGDILVQNSDVSIDVSMLSVGGNLIVDGVELSLSTDSVSVSGNISVVNGGIITVPSDVVVSPILTITALGDVFVDQSSAIDVSEKGYLNDDLVWPNGEKDIYASSCHGGLRTGSSLGCVYGDYKHARFPGSGGSGSAGYGGGVIQLVANALQLDGILAANGGDGYIRAGSGGAIHLDMATLSGAGSLQVNGGKITTSTTNASTGSGGRISVYVNDRVNFSGGTEAHGGYRNGVSAGAGTVYVRENNVSEYLSVNNAGVISFEGSTPIKSVGKHEITGVDYIEEKDGESIWRIEAVNAEWTETDVTLSRGLQGIAVDLDASDSIGALYSIKSNTVNTLTIAVATNLNVDLSGIVGQSLVGVHVLDGLDIRGNASVDFGDDRLVINDSSRFYVEMGSEIKVGQLDQNHFEELVGHTEELSNGLWATYFDDLGFSSDKKIERLDSNLDLHWTTAPHATIYQDTFSVIWKGKITAQHSETYNLEVDVNDRAKIWINGQLVHTVDESGVTTFTYDFIENVANDILIQYEEDTSTANFVMSWSSNSVAKEVVPSSAYTATRGSSGRVIVGELLGSDGLVIQGGFNGEIVFDGVVDNANVTVLGGEVNFSQPINITGDFIVMPGAKVRVPSVTANSVLIKENATFITTQIDSTALNLAADSLLTTTVNDELGRAEPLVISAKNVEVAVSAEIDVSGKGYQVSDMVWPNADIDSSLSGCHGGLRRNAALACVYGDYKHAQFAGSAGEYQNSVAVGLGGGVIQLTADNLLLNGSLTANGMFGRGRGGAGGAIHLDVGTLSGEGLVQANGGIINRNTTNSGTGSGGRISLYVNDRSSFGGQLEAEAATGNALYTSGAGTVYVLENGLAEYLSVNNGGISSFAGSTPIKSIGRHEITGVDWVGESAGEVIWRIEVLGAPWLATDLALARGLQGLSVDLDASDSIGDLYTVKSNTINTLTVSIASNLNVDLSGVVGQMLIGVHLLDGLDVRGNASVDFGEDRLVIGDPSNFYVEMGSELHVGQLEQSHFEALAGQATELSNGLWGIYYNDLGFQSKTFERFDNNLDLYWSGGAPHSLMSADTFSIKWKGKITAPSTETYTLEVDADDRAKIWIDGSLVHSVAETSVTNFTYDFIANESYDLLVEYEEESAQAKIVLSWSSASVPKEVIPSSAYTAIRGQGGKIVVGEFLGADGLVLQGGFEGELVFDGVIDDANILVTGGEVSFTQPLNISGKLTVMPGAQVSAVSVVAAEVEVKEGATLTTANVNATTLSLAAGSMLTTTVNNELGVGNPLIINTNSMVVDATAAIDLSSKGYRINSGVWPDGEVDVDRAGCHAGLRRSAVPECLYGDYKHAQFVGSSGDYASTGGTGYGGAGGGGSLQLTADSLLLNGRLLANGAVGYNYGGAGGAIHLDIATLSGTGLIQTNGGTIGRNRSGSGTGSGGRISVYVDDMSAFVGQLESKAGSGNALYVSGAGTIFIRENGASEHLFASNGGEQSLEASTPIRSVGRHEISGVDLIGNENGKDIWRIEVLGNPWLATDIDFARGLQGIAIDLNAADTIGDVHVIASNTPNTVTLEIDESLAVDLNGIVGQELVGVHYFETMNITGGASVGFGGDHIVVNDLANSSIDTGGSLSAGWVSQSFIENVLKDGGDISLSTSLTLENLNLDILGTARLTVPGIHVGGDMTLLNGTLELLLIEDTKLDVVGDLTLGSSAVLTSLPSSLGGYPLDISVTGTMHVETGSVVDVSGNGYQAAIAWDYGVWPLGESDLARAGCHGGVRDGASDDCVYGDYRFAQFAGSSGNYYLSVYSGGGGGVISILANTLVLDGELRANGSLGYFYGGAGGSIHLDVDTLTGAGLLQSNGGEHFQKGAAGAGGRVSVYSNNRLGFNGQFEVHSGTSSSNVGGAGTLYFLDNGSEEHLVVDSGNLIALSNSTLIRSVGRHEISAATFIGNSNGKDIWKISVAGEPWLATNASLAQGIQGVSVDLDAGNIEGDQYVVASNTENSLTIEISDNLLADLNDVVGQELIGVHHFETLTVRNGASVDFGGDRVEVNDFLNSSISANSNVSAGWVSQAFIEGALKDGGHISLVSPLLLENLNLDISGVARITVPGLSVNGDMGLSGGVLELEMGNDKLDVVGNLTINSSATLTSLANDLGAPPLNIAVSGTMLVEAGSSIDVTGFGYQSTKANLNYKVWPFGENNADWSGCHGGIRYGSDVNCTYGDYHSVQFVGSSGEYYSPEMTGAGGGALNLDVGVLILNGSLSANGVPGYRRGGAGGSIHLDVGTMTGGGAVQSMGASVYLSAGDWASGAGGRISVYSNDRSGYSGVFEASAGISTHPSGAGTVYLLGGNGKEHLVLDNAGQSALNGSSPIRSVGRHEIISVELIENSNGKDIWRIGIDNTSWLATNLSLAQGIQGLLIDLDASDTEGAQYLVTSNTEDTLTLEISDDLQVDLNGIAGQDLIGVHYFETLTVTGGASVDFGGDRVVVNDLSSSSISSGGTVQAGWISEAFLESVLKEGGHILLDSPLTLQSLTLDVSGVTRLTVPGLNIEGNMVLSNGSLELVMGDGKFNVKGNLTINNSATLTSVADDLGAPPLNIAVAGTMLVEAGSSVDVTGFGYQSTKANLNYKVWPFGENDADWSGCHGGIQYGGGINCTYGDYRLAHFVGSSGEYYTSTMTGAGGGALNLDVGALILEGSLTANGVMGYRRGGAGGSIHLDVGTMTGAGSLQSLGGSVYLSAGVWASGAGGRISVYSNDRTGYSGVFEASAGISTRPSGAGTVYLRDGNTKNNLAVNNAGQSAQGNSTPIRSVGRHVMTAVEFVGNAEGFDLWQVTVSGSPWESTNLNLAQGIQEIFVDLDASDLVGDQYIIVSNTENTLTFKVNESLGINLGGVVGQELVGAHHFETLTISGGASVGFGDDFIFVDAIDGLQVDGDSTLVYGNP